MLMIHLFVVIILENIERLTSILRTKFEITINDAADEYLGIHLKQLKDGSIQMIQPKILKNLFEEYHEHIQLYNRKSTIITSPFKRHNNNNNNNNSNNTNNYQQSENQSIDSKKYLHLLGALNYLTKSRPDILANVSFAATKSSNPTERDYQDLINILLYIYQTREHSIILKPAATSEHELILRCYVDASYLVHPDSKSHTGYALSFGEIGTFYAKSIKQPLVATSSSHAEMRALYTAIQDIIFVINLCKNMKINLKIPAIIFEDNQPVIQLAMTTSTGIKKMQTFSNAYRFY
jgi:hypothetical protein